MREVLLGSLGLLTIVSIAFWVIAWFTVLPTMGLLWMMGGLP